MNTYKKELAQCFPKIVKAIIKTVDDGKEWANGWPTEKPYKSNLCRDDLIELFCKREFIWQFGEDLEGNG